MTTQLHGQAESTASDGPSDAELITAVRAGDSDAYATLYDRHQHAALRLARTLARDPSEADDLVAEAFTRILATLQSGRGPDLAFRAYLHTTIRHTFYDRVRATARTQPVEEVPEPEPAEDAATPTMATLDQAFATRAFQTLPERWQLVLWHTEVEGDSPATIAPLLGLTPNGVAALAYRARERLRQAYLQAHLADSPPNPECATVTPLLAADIRGNLSARDHAKVESHLQTCSSCKTLYAELTDLNSNLKGLLAPAVLGTTWAAYLGLSSTAAKAGILAWLGTGPAAWVASGANQARRVYTKVGPRNTAIAGGTAAGVAAVAIAIALLTGNPTPPTTSAKPPAAAAPTDVPTGPAPSDAPTTAPPETPAAGPETTPTAPSEAPSPTSASPNPSPSSTRPGPPGVPTPPITITPRDTSFTAGRMAVLPIEIENTSTGGSGGSLTTGHKGKMTLVVRLPDEFLYTGLPAGDGWWCVRGDNGNPTCTRKALAPGESSVAKIQLYITHAGVGTHDVTATVTLDGARVSKTFQVTVAKPRLPLLFGAESKHHGKSHHHIPK